MNTNATTRLVFAIDIKIANELKKRIPARKRSQFIETLIEEQFDRDEKTAAWETIQKFRKTYNRSKDPIKLAVVDWVRKDRGSH